MSKTAGKAAATGKAKDKPATKPAARPTEKPASKGRQKREVLNLSYYVTYYFTVLANKLSSGASRLYLKRYDIGIIEWRVLAMVAIEPGIAAARVTTVIGIDKASVSRESRRLVEKGYLTVTVDPTNARRNILELTPEGYELHDRIIQVALERERRLLSDLSPEEIDVFVKLLHRTTAKIPYVNEFDPDSTAAERTKPQHRKNTHLR